MHINLVIDQIDIDKYKGLLGETGVVRYNKDGEPIMASTDGKASGIPNHSEEYYRMKTMFSEI